MRKHLWSCLHRFLLSSDRKPALQSKRWHSSVKDGLIKKTHCIMGCVECRFVLAQIFYYHFASSPKSCSMYTIQSIAISDC